MKGVITEFTDNSITFHEDGVKELQKFELAEHIKPEFFKVGRANLTVHENVVNFVSMEGSVPKTDKTTDKKEISKSKNPYIVNISGKDFMTYEGLLNKVHEKKKMFSMEIKNSWVSEDMKRAWCIVRLTVGKQTFDGFGSSTPDNTGQMTQSHPVEMSHTRAKGRALRDYLNIGQAMAEELKGEKNESQ